MQCLLQQFRDFYEKKLVEVDDKWSVANTSVEEIQKIKIDILRAYIDDLAEQNLVLVETAEELQKETQNRVAVLEQLLQKTTTVSKEYMCKIHAYQQQLQKYHSEKVKAVSLLESLQSKCLIAEEESNILRDQNAYLNQDVAALMQLNLQSNSASNWENSSENCEVISENAFSPVERLSTSDSCFVRHSPTEVQCRDCSFLSEDFSRSLAHHEAQRKMSTPSVSLSCLSYDGVYSQVTRPTEKDVLVKRLQVDLKYAQKAQRDAGMRLLEKDHTIAALQSQITELRHEMSVKDCECASHLLLLQHNKDQQRRASIELSRYDETLHQLKLHHEDNNFINKCSVLQNGASTHKLSEVESITVEPAKTMCVSATQTTNSKNFKPLNGSITGSAWSDDPPQTFWNISNSPLLKPNAEGDLENGINGHELHTLPEIDSVKNNKLDSTTQTDSICKTDSSSEIQHLKSELKSALLELNSLRKSVISRDESNLQLKQRLEEVQNQVQQYENRSSETKEESVVTTLREELLTVQEERDAQKIELSKVQEELSFVEASAQEMRSVLAREIAERHDTIKALRQELTDQADHHKEMVQQLVLKTEVIKDLRKEAKLAQTKVEEKASAEEQLHETLRILQEQVEKQSLELDNQKITIGNLQQALVQSKRGVEVPPLVATVNGTSSVGTHPKQRLPSREVFDI